MIDKEWLEKVVIAANQYNGDVADFIQYLHKLYGIEYKPREVVLDIRVPDNQLSQVWYGAQQVVDQIITHLPPNYTIKYNLIDGSKQ